MDVFAAAKAGDLTALIKHVSGGGSFNSRERSGMTPLMIAVDCEQTDAVKLLLKEGVNINAKDKWGQTALMLAVKKNNINGAKLLLKSRANLNTIAGNGLTALGYATNASAEMSKLLKQAGAR